MILSENAICRFYRGLKTLFKTFFGLPVHPNYQFLLSETWRQGFLTFCTSDWLGRWHLDPSQRPESLKSAGYRQQGQIIAQRHTHFFKRGQKWPKMVKKGTFWDLTRLLEGVKGSDLVQIARNTFPDVVEGLT